MKAHNGVDADSGLVHTVTTTANEGDGATPQFDTDVGGRSLGGRQLQRHEGCRYKPER
jgi:hypothetical protein